MKISTILALLVVLVLTVILNKQESASPVLPMSNHLPLSTSTLYLKNPLPPAGMSVPSVSPIQSPDEADTELNTFGGGLPDTVKANILWYCDYEDNTFYKWEGEGTDTPYAGGGIFITDEENTEYGIQNSIAYSGKLSAYATIKNALTPGENKAVRLMRWTDKPWDKEGKYFPDQAYYSTFFLLQNSYNPQKDPNNDPNGDGSWGNVFQFKSKNHAGSQPLVILDLYNESGKMVFGLVIKDYPDDNSSSYNFQYIIQHDPLGINAGVWNHIEAYYEKSSDYTGKVVFWLSGVKIFEKNNIRTVLPADETAVWGIGNYTDYINGGETPGTATIYNIF